MRSVAADVVARAADPADLPGARRGCTPPPAATPFPEAALSALDAILAIRKTGPAAQARVDREFLLGADPARELSAPAVGRGQLARGGRVAGGRPTRSPPAGRCRTTGTWCAATSPAPIRWPGPTSIIETEGRGPIEIELLGPDAPLTVDNFLRLVDRRFFDRNRWHRVVPNFVVQDGDPRGDGFGSPGGAIRDEINRNRYDAPMLGMALSGPDTGMSQWFINLSAQPHLDGTYTVFGKVVGGTATLFRITQGDVIRTVARK